MTARWMLFYDQETTGLDPSADLLLEAAAILIDPDGAEVDRWHGIVAHGPTIREHMAPEVVAMHEANGLLDACMDSGYGVEATVDLALSDWLIGHTSTDDADPCVTLCGSGVAHFDLPWMIDQGWQLPTLLTYYTIDVGHLRRTFAAAGLPSPHAGSSSAKTHRAMDDVEAHLAEYRWCVGVIRAAAGIVAAVQEGGVMDQMTEAEFAAYEAGRLVGARVKANAIAVAIAADADAYWNGPNPDRGRGYMQGMARAASIARGDV